MKRLLFAFLISSISFAQTYKVKDKYGNDTGIRLEKEKSAYEQGFEAGYGKPTENNKGNTIIINNYSSNSSGNYSSGYSSGYTRGEKKRASKWVKRRLKKRNRKRRRRRN